jgi:putative oxidoreductase
MNVALWIVQGLLAVAYLGAGVMKATQPLDQLAQRMEWASSSPPTFVRFIGIAEILGAIGLILPLATGVLPGLTVAAAVGLVLVQVAASAFHVSRNEVSVLPVNLVLLLLAVFVVYGRLAIVPA